MEEIWERRLDAEEVAKAVCRFARMSAPSCGSLVKFEINDRRELLGVTIRQRGWNRIDGQCESVQQLAADADNVGL